MYNLKYLYGRGKQALGYEKSGQKTIDDVAKKLYKLQPYQREFTNIKLGDPNEKAEGAIDWFVAIVGQQIPNLMESMAMAIAGGLVGTPIGGLYAATFGKQMMKQGLQKLVQSGVNKRMKGEVLSQAEKAAITKAAGTLGATIQSINGKQFVAGGIRGKLLRDLQEGVNEAIIRKELLRSRGKYAGAFGGMFLGSYAMGVGDIYGELRETGSDMNSIDAKAAAFQAAVPYALLDIIPEYLLGARIFSGGGAMFTKHIMKGKNRTTRAVSGGLFGTAFEGGAESGQEIINMTVAAAINNKKYLPDEYLHRLINAGAAGAAIGGALGGVSGLFTGNPVDLTQVATDPDGDTTPPNLIPKKKVQKITTDIFGKRKRQAKKDQTLQGSVNKILGEGGKESNVINLEDEIKKTLSKKEQKNLEELASEISDSLKKDRDTSEIYNNVSNDNKADSDTSSDTTVNEAINNITKDTNLKRGKGKGKGKGKVEVTEEQTDATIPDDVKVGDTLELYNARGEKVQGTVEAISKVGTLRVNMGENTVIVNRTGESVSPQASTENIKNPNYIIKSKVPNRGKRIS